MDEPKLGETTPAGLTSGGIGIASAVRWSRLPTSAIFDGRLSAETLRALAVLCIRVNTDGIAFPRILELASDLGCTERQVQSHLRKLEACGLVATRAQMRPKAGGQTANRYEVQYQKLHGTGPWVKLPLAAVLDRRISAEALRVLAAVGSYGGRGRTAFPSANTLAARLGVKPRQVRVHLKALVKAGHLLILRRSTKRGWRLSNVYVLTFGNTFVPAPAGAHRRASGGISGVKSESASGLKPERPLAAMPDGMPGMKPGDTLISPNKIENGKQPTHMQWSQQQGLDSQQRSGAHSERSSPYQNRNGQQGNHALRGSRDGVGGAKPRAPRPRVDIAGFKETWAEILTDAKLREAERGLDATSRTWEGFIQDLQRIPGTLRSAIKHEVLVAVGRRLNAATRPQSQARDADSPSPVDPEEFKQDWIEALIRSHQFNPEYAWKMWGNFEDALTSTQVPYKIRREVIDAVSLVIGSKTVWEASGP